MLKPSSDCLDIIKEFEGYHTKQPDGSCKAYRDPGSVDGKPYTIGWGTTRYRTAGLAKYGRTGVLLSDTLTAAEARAELNAAADVFAAAVNKMTKSLTQSQFDAAVSFFYNTGTNNKQAERLRSGDLAGFVRMLPAYNKGASSKPLAGLVRRRKAELDLWNKDARNALS